MLLRIFAVIALIALAIGSWYLTGPMQTKAAAPTKPAAPAPGYYLKGVELTDFAADGSQAMKIAAERIEQVQGSDDIALQTVRVDYQTPTGQLWLITGNRARVHGDHKMIDMDGNVRLRGLDRGRDGPAMVITETLSYDVDSSTAHTDADVRIEFARHTLNAHGLTALLKERSMRLESKIYGRFAP
jgi:LPS export ABC transporter protein LptC